MAEAKKTKAGTWTCLVYSHTEIVNGKPKRIYQRFTAERKRDAEKLAKDFEINHKKEKLPNEMTVREAIEKYIELKSNILSPSTIRGYWVICRNRYPLIGHIKLNRLTNEKIQAEINQESAKYSPKYIHNIYGLLTSALDMFAPGFQMRTSYPENRQKEITIPSAADISLLLRLSASDDLSLAIMIASYLGLRRGEISGIKIEDVDLKSNILYVRHSIVRNNENEWVEKEPKTKAGRRSLDIPDLLITPIQTAASGKAPKDKLVNLNPSQITDGFETLVKKAAIPECTFHSLRHFNASLMLANKVPNKYAMQRMGHSTENMLQRVYQHTMKEKEREISNQFNKCLSDIFLQ